MERILVAGTGRSGSTFLMQMLTELHYDTGMRSQGFAFNVNVRAGFEMPINYEVEMNDNWDYVLKTPPGKVLKLINEMPQIIKSPEFSSILKCLLSNKVIEVKHVIIPLRDVDQAARSRIKVGLDLKRTWMSWGVAEEGREKKQKMVLYSMLGRLLEVLVLYDIPYTIIKYPDMIYNANYLLDKLKGVFPDLNEEEFWRIFPNVARPELVTVK